MNGGDYFVCKLDIGPGTVYMSAQAHVRIFVDTPEHCGLASGATQVNISGNGNIVSSGYNPKQGLYEIPDIYLLGNGAVSIGANSGTNHMMLYAPQSAIDIGGNAEWIGHDRRQVASTCTGTPFFKIGPEHQRTRTSPTPAASSAPATSSAPAPPLRPRTPTAEPRRGRLLAALKLRLPAVEGTLGEP